MRDIGYRFGPANVASSAIYVEGRQRQAGRITITLKQSSYADTWRDHSLIMVKWKSADLPRFFRLLIEPVAGPAPYVLMVWSKKTRYKLQENVGENCAFPLYDGQTLHDDTVFELWTTATTDSGVFPEVALSIEALDGNKALVDITIDPSHPAFASMPIPGPAPITIHFT